MRFLFPDNTPPALPNDSSVDEACVWLLAVMDKSDKARRFVSSILTYWYDRGYISEKQMDGLRSAASRVIGQYMAGELESQGAVPAKNQRLEFGNVIELSPAKAGKREVLE